MTSTKIALMVAASLCLTACKEPNAPVVAPVVPEASPAPASSPAAVASPVAPTVADSAALAALDAEKPQAAITCNLESGNDQLFTAAAMPLKAGDSLRGWLGHDTPSALDAPRILVRDAQGASVAAVTIVPADPRDDVAAANGGREDLRMSGFKAVLPQLPAGTFALVLRYRVAEQAFVCDNGRRIRID